MTETLPAETTARRTAALVEYGIAAAVGALLATAALIPVPGYSWIALACFAAAAVAIAVVDVRTNLLPNRYTGPLALAAALQATAVATQRLDPWVAVVAAAAAAVVFLAYTAMGMAGWFGFGDTKFAGALALLAGTFAGWLAIYLVPLAVLISAAERAVRMTAGRSRKAHAHGPAIAIAAIAIAIAGIMA